MNTPSPAMLDAQARRLAALYVVADIESNAERTVLGGWVWWDTAPMLSAHEHCPQIIDMARQAIDYALATGLAMRHPTQPHLLHILTPGA